MKSTKSLEFKIEKNCREYKFIVPEDGPLGEIYDSVAEVLLYISDLMKQSIPKKPSVEEFEPAGFESDDE